MPGRPFFKRETRKNSISFFNTYNLLLSVEFASTGLPTKRTSAFLAPLANGRGLPINIC
jgi:hypothetical protein